MTGSSGNLGYSDKLWLVAALHIRNSIFLPSCCLSNIN